MTKKPRILLVEDERTLAEIVSETLQDKGFDVMVAFDGEQAWIQLTKDIPDMVVSDIMMPCLDGFSLVKRIRKTLPSLPILLLSARSEAEDVVEGLELGANDYMRKPFAISELIARIRVLLRLGQMEVAVETRFQIGLYDFDAEARHLLFEKTLIPLSYKESALLHILCLERGRIIPMKLILEKLWGDDSYYNGRSLHVFITKLRHHLSQDPQIHLLNIRGVGYQLRVG